MNRVTRFGLFSIVFFVVSSVLVPIANGTPDEEGPLITSAVVSPTGSLQPGDVISIVLTMYDPGGSGIRNTQFTINDKFGRNKTPFNGMDCGLSCTMYASGNSVSEVTFQFLVDETWGTDGFATLGSIRVFDKLTNGTYFYSDGKYQNLQTRGMYPGKHPLADLRITLGSPPSASTTTSSTSPSSTTTKPSSTNKTPGVTIPSLPTTSSSSSTTPSVNSVVEMPTIMIMSNASAASLAKLANIEVQSPSRVTLRVIPGSAKNCKVSRGALRGLKAGSCKVAVTVTPEKGKSTSKTITLMVTK